MESKKLQQLQQANSHLAPQPMPHTKAPSFHPTTGDYRSAHSPVFQNHPQYQSLSSNFAQINMTGHQHQPVTQGSQQPHLHVKPVQNSHSHLGTAYAQQQQQQLQQQQQQQTPTAQQLGHYHANEQLYQNNRERLYQQAPARTHYNQNHHHLHQSQGTSQLQQQYQQLQQAKVQAQIQTQNEAIVQQQRTFAMRQQLNPPVPQSHYHLQSQTSLNQISMPVQQQPQQQPQQQQQQLPQQHQPRSVPPSSLNLTNQFQPATGPLKINDHHSHYGTTILNQMPQQHGHMNLTNVMQNHKMQSQAIYQQNQQIQQQLIQSKMHQQKSPQDQIIIQKNHPGLVMNQACQTQISGQVHKPKTQPETNTTPTHQPLDRKKSGGGPIALKSPITKRPTTAPVTLAGWLYKQGSDGLKVWRKRWFVLSEYCLFYYKSPEEEKLLGSILLPSYRVAACSPEDKIYRKFAFKCEHANMRTYWLAAETAESMGQWVRALTAATMMQGSSESSDHTSQPSVSSLNQSGENSDSGIHTYQSQQSKVSALPGQGPLTPASDGGNGPQPLYANAPPKPRRANDGGYSSPSPENSVERYDSSYEPRYHESSTQHGRRLDVKSPMPHQSDPLYEVRRQLAKSPDPTLAARLQQVRLDNNKSPNVLRTQVRSPYPGEGQYGVQDLTPQMASSRPHMHPAEEAFQINRGEHIIRAPQRFDDFNGQQIYGEASDRDREIYMQRLAQQQKYPSQGNMTALYPNAERRTPDTYGRSRSGQQEGRRNFSDYEDIYNLQQQAELGAYRRPMSPIGYQNNRNIPNMPARYTPNYLEPNAAQHVQMRARPVQSTMIPRPHSADFLEFEARNADTSQMHSEPARAPRPKSSLDINRGPDSYYYSEASYAEKLRQSALYQTKPASMPAGKTRPDDYTTQYNQFNDIDNNMKQMSNSMPRDVDYDRSQFTTNPGAQSVPRVHRQPQKGYMSQQEQFLRSASARLPRKEEETNGRDGERKREESMKRLLEWKQRMLQSPLTRKGAPLSTPTQSKSPIPNVVMNQGLQRSRSETHANAGYNSYSSDDEGGPQFSPAGRSSPSPRTQSSSLATKVQSSSKEPISNVNIKTFSTSLLDQDTYVPVYAQKTVTDTLLHNSTFIARNESIKLSTKIIAPLEKKIEEEVSNNASQLIIVEEKILSEIQPVVIESIEKHREISVAKIILDSCDIKNDNENDDDDTVEDNDDEDDDDDDKTFEYTDDDLDEALLEEHETSKADEMEEPKTPTNVVPENYELNEGHYMPMTPKKTLLTTSVSDSGIFKSITEAMELHEENPYVEMTQGKIHSILGNDLKSNYEFVCVKSSKSDTEPVYMELSQLKTGIEIESGKTIKKKSSLKKYNTEGRKIKKQQEMQFSKRTDLPDILKASQNILKSDSSDADDEASKDLDATELKSRSRFSLSDTFRPASYYLGASTPLAECADSSDSEIVSPPPIPKSPPPMEDLNSEEIFSSENYDTVKRKEKQMLNHSFDQIPKLHISSSDFDLNKTEGHKTSRLSLPDHLYKYGSGKKKLDMVASDYISLTTYSVENKMYSGSVNSCNTDDGSNTSSDYDLYNKLKLESPSFTSDVLYNSNNSLPTKFPRTRNSESETESVELRHSADLALERQMKRRPLSEDSFSEIDSIENTFDEAIASTDLDRYLNKLQSSDLYLNTSSEQTSWMHDSLTKIGDIHYIKPPEVFRTENDSYYENMNLSNRSSLKEPDSFSEPILSLPKAVDKFQIGELVAPSAIPSSLRPESVLSNTNGTYYDSLEDKTETLNESNASAVTLSPLKEKNLSLHNAQCESEDLKSGFNLDLNNSVTLSSADVDQQSTCTAFDMTRPSPMHSRGNSNVSDGSAPYYYSDLVSRSNQEISESRTSLNQQKLNNQRDVGMRKTGISHIHNPIHQRSHSNDKQYDNNAVAAEARSISVEILNVTDKEKLIDSRNLYESEHEKLEKNVCKEGSFSNKLKCHDYNHRLNTLDVIADNEISLGDLSVIHKSNNTLNESSSSRTSNTTTVENLIYNATHFPIAASRISDVSAGEQLWEEDTLWRESLRRVSHRHARSLDDLDRICSPSSASIPSPFALRASEADKEWDIQSKSSTDSKSRQTKLSREVTYVNDNVSPQNRTNSRKKLYRKKASDKKPKTSSIATMDNDENDVYVQLMVDNQNSDVYETLRDDRSNSSKKSCDIDREKIRQWDSMSSGLMKCAGSGGGDALGGNTANEINQNRRFSGSEMIDVQASISVRNVRNVQKSQLSVKPDPSDPIDINRTNHLNNNISYYHQDNENKLIKVGNDYDPTRDRFYMQQDEKYDMASMQATKNNQQWPMRKSGSHRDIDHIERETVSAMRNLDMSAGDLLSRTHEELVLLLIQLRRQNSATARAIEQCCTDIHEMQNRIRTSEGPNRAENISRLDTLKQQLIDLEKQYEKSKPLVNLVDNMVKLGALYRGGPNSVHNRQASSETVTLDRLEFNQRVQERRLLQEERKHWDRLSPNHTELQTKVQQLYQLDQLLQEESGTLQSLQRDKEDLERALGGLRARLQNGTGPPIALEAARKQQHALERELSRVHQLLAENSKKLEQTVAGNARLEQELLVLRQKLQASRGTRGSQTGLGSQGAPDSVPYAGGATALLESDVAELRRVQQLVGDMQRQRQELSQAVRQLTENSNSLYQQIKPNEMHGSHIKKRPQASSWMETDLDSMVSTDHASYMSSNVDLTRTDLNSSSTMPLYVDTSSANSTVNLINCSTSSKLNDSDNKLNNSRNYYRHQESDGIESSGVDSDDLLEGSGFGGLSLQDKQEIKTVRIVKRESERRQRDRERTNSSSQNLDQVLEEESHIAEEFNNYNRSKSLPRTYVETYEVYNQVKPQEMKPMEQPSKPYPIMNNNMVYGSSPALVNSKYSDYYNPPPPTTAPTNHYPVSMTDHQLNLTSPKYFIQPNDDKQYKNPFVVPPSEPTGLKNKTESIQSLTKTIGDLSPVFQSEAARQIIYEMSGNTSEENNEKVPMANKQRRAVPKEKRRHYTAPNNVNVKTMQQVQSENDMNKNNTNWRARDDLDMEVALRPRSNAPDVVRSALGPREKISENTIDKLLAAPSKILIPERYIPEQPPELSPEEKKRRQEKVEAIKKMLSEVPINPSNDSNSAPPSQISAEKKQREHLLQLNQILAQQVMQMSKIVAGNPSQSNQK